MLMNINSGMKISGLFTPDKEELLEHLGNLDVIDKELVKALMMTYDVGGQMIGIGWKPETRYDNGKDKLTGQERWNDGRARRTVKVPNAIGRNSALEDKQLSVSEAIHALTEDLNVAGLVFKFNGKQAVMIRHDLYANKRPVNGVTKKPGYKEGLGFTWMMTKTFVRELQKVSQKYPPVTSKKTVLSELGEAIKGGLSESNNKGRIESLDKIGMFIKTLAMSEWLKTNAEAKSMPKEPALPKFDVILIRPDEQRQQAHVARKVARKGQVPVPRTPAQLKMPGASYMSSSHNVYIRELAGHLHYRLNQHKNKKAGAFETPADMLKHFIDEGYLKKLIFMGVPYNLKDNRIEFEDLMLGPKSQEKSYIEYVSEKTPEWDDPRHAAVRDEYKALRASMADKAPPPPAWIKDKIEKAETDEAKAKELQEWQESWAYEAAKPKMAELYLKHKCEPSKILVKLVLDGGKIIPHHFEMKFDRY